MNKVAMTGTVTSAVTIVQKLSLISYSASWTGTTPVGNLLVQVSNDFSINVDGSTNNAGTWNNLPLSVSGSSVTAIPISGNTGNGMIDITNTGIYAIRTQYQATSGSGTLTVIINAKVD